MNFASGSQLVLTYIVGVVHDAGVVVGDGERVNLVAGVADEVELCRGYHILPHDLDIVIPVWPSLLVEEAQRVTEFVKEDARVLAKWLLTRTNGYLLVPSLPSDIRPTPVGACKRVSLIYFGLIQLIIP